MGALDRIIDSEAERRRPAAAWPTTGRALGEEASAEALMSALLMRLGDPKSRQKLMESLDATEANRGIVNALKVISDTQMVLKNLLESIIAKEDRSQDILESINRLRRAIQGVRVPEADLGPVLEAIADLKALETSEPEAPEEWTFEVNRETFSGRIESVTAKRDT